jgi:hypothetical protein
MTRGKFVTAFGLFAALLVATPALVEAQRGGSRVPPAGGGAGRVPPGPTGRAVPRTGPPPRVNGGPYYGYGRPYYGGYYRPYYHAPYYYSPYYYGPWAPGFSVGFSFGFGYPYGYAYGAWGYPYGYYGYGYPADGYPNAGYSYMYGRPYGGVRIDLPQRDAEVWADGYFAGTVDNFDGSMQALNLAPGTHRIEVRQQGFEPVSFEVNVEPGRTVTYRTALRPTP